MAQQGDFTEFRASNLLHELLLSINSVVTSVYDGLRINHLSTEQQYKFRNDKQLQYKLKRYIKLLLFDNNTLAVTKHKSALNTFNILIHNIDQYIILISESLYFDSLNYKLYRELHYKLLINNILSTLFSFKFKVNEDNEIPLFYDNELISTQSAFKQLIYSYSNDKQSIPSDTLHGISRYFQNEYYWYLNKYNILYLNGLDLNKTLDFKKGYARILSTNYKDIDMIESNYTEDIIINTICGWSVCLLLQNTDKLLFASYICLVEEYYGYFKAKKPFLCFYCNKLMSKQLGLLQHIRASHEIYDDYNSECTTTPCMDYICYIMLIQLFILMHKMNYATNTEWFPDNVLTKYINRLQIISKQFNLNDIETEMEMKMNKMERLESIINNTNNILLTNKNENDTEHTEINDTYYASLTPPVSPQYADESKEKTEFDSLPFETKRAMMTGHYIACKLHSYFKRHHYCTECDENYMFILDHMYIVGGAIRNYLIGRNINDLDIIVDTLKLQYLQNKHLFYYHELKYDEEAFKLSENINSKYVSNTDDKLWDKNAEIPVIPQDTDYGLQKHSANYKKWILGKKANCKCLWYLQFYKKITYGYKYRRNDECLDWRFNAITLSRILLKEMKNDLNGKQCVSVFVDKHKVIKCVVKSHLIIQGIDIYGQSIDITDTSNHSFSKLSSGKSKKQTLNEYYQKNPNQCNYNNDYFYYSYAQNRWIQKLKYATIKNHNSGKYHQCSLKNDIINRDLTMNALLLPLSKILTKKQCFVWNKCDIIDFVNGLYDIERRIFCVAPQNTVKHILVSSPIRLLRVIKYCMTLGGDFSIDSKLKQGISLNGYLLNSISCTVIQQLFMPLVQLYLNDMDKTKLLLAMLMEYNLTGILIEIMMKEAAFCRNFLNVVSELHPDIQCVYNQHKYPSMFSVNDTDLPKALKLKKQQIMDQKRCDYNLLQVVRIIDCLLMQFDI